LKKRGIIVIGIVAAIIVSISALSGSTIVDSGLVEKPSIEESASIAARPIAEDQIKPGDSVAINPNSTGFYIDKNGIKHHMLEVVDSPKIGG